MKMNLQDGLQVASRMLLMLCISMLPVASMYGQANDLSVQDQTAIQQTRSTGCEFNMNTFGLSVFGSTSSSGYHHIQEDSTVSVGGFNDYLICSEVDILFTGSGFHDFWLQSDARMDIDGASGFFNVFAVNRNEIVLSSFTSGNYYIGAGSTMRIEDYVSATIYLECGAHLIIEADNFSGIIYSECPDADITDVQGGLGLNDVSCCSDINYTLPVGADVGPQLNLGGFIDLDTVSFPFQLDASSDGGPYEWSTGETTSTIQVNSPGSYFCDIASDCGRSTGTAIIGSYEEMVVGQHLGNDLTICPTEFPISLDAGIGREYQWSTGSTEREILIDSPGTYSVVVSGYCGDVSDTIVVSTNSTITPVHLGSDTTVCPSDFPFTLNAGIGDSYLWNTGDTIQSISISDAGTYAVTVFGACSSTSDTIVVNTNTSLPSVDLGPDTTVCPGDFPFSLDVNVGDSYLWNTGDTTQTISISDAGTYAVTVSGACSSTSDTIVVNANTTLPSVDLGPDTTLCQSDFPFSLNANVGDSYLWNTGDTTHTISISDAGTYAVTVTGACSNTSDTIVVNANTSLPSIDLGPDTTVCSGDFPISLEAGMADSYLWNTGDTAQSISISDEGTYAVTVFGACSTASDTIVVNANTTLPSVDLSSDTTVCPGDFPFSLDAGMADSYLWNTGDTTQSISISDAGTYTVTVFGACGSIEDEVEISLQEFVTFSLGPDLVLCPSAIPYSLGIDNSTPEAIWSTGSQEDTILITAPGVYWIEYLSSCGHRSDSIELSFLDDQVEFIQDTLCTGDTLRVAEMTVTGGGFYSTILENQAENGCDVFIELEIEQVTSTHDTLYFDLSSDAPIYYGNELLSEVGNYSFVSHTDLCPNYTHVTVSQSSEANPIVYIPDAFSPNGDGVNEYFSPVIALEDHESLDLFSFQVFDRDGHVVYESIEYSSCRWDGQYPFSQNFYSADGIYHWLLDFRISSSTRTKRLSGRVTMLR